MGGSGVTNHPNRNWRQRMQAAADQWLETSHARVLIEVPIGARTEQEYLDGMRQRVREAYLVGYQDGRRRDE